MTNILKIPTQKELDSCATIYDKLLLKKPEITLDLSERDTAQLFAEVTRPYFKYNVTRAKWMYYNGKYWEEDIGNIHISKVMKDFTKAFKNYAINIVGTSNEDFYNLALELGKASKRKTLIKDAVDINFITDEAFDSDIFLFNCINGTLNLQTGQFLPHNPDDLISKISNVIYQPNITSDILDNFMNEIFCNDADLIAYIYRVFGYCLSGSNNQECMFTFLGETTRNGKSTLLNTFAYLLGENKGYARNIDIASLAQKRNLNGAAPSSDICRLKGARFVMASEPAPDFVLDESKIKAFTGSDTITARQLYQSEIEFKPTFKIFIGTNHRPNISDDSVLESNRLRVVPFNRHFKTTEQNKNLKDLLRNPDVISAFFNRCIDGYRDFCIKGLCEPEAVITATSSYQTQNQIFQSFLDNQLQQVAGAVIPLAVFYPLYTAWCTENAFTPLSREKVNSYMRTKGIFKAHATVNGKTVRNILTGYQQKTEKDIEPLQAQYPF